MLLEARKILWSLALMLLLFVTLKFCFDAWFISESTIDIHLHDTYFVIEMYQVYLLLFIASHFIVNTLYNLRTQHFNKFSNVLYLIEIAIVYIITEFLANLLGILNQGWTSYPPLSALEDSPNVIQEPLFSFSLLAIPFVLYSIWYLYRWSKWAKDNR